MKLFLMRHGIAADIDGEAHDDASRPLTQQGQAKTRQAANGLLRSHPRLGLIASSPLLRARQTAEIVQQVYRVTPTGAALQVWDELEQATYPDLVARVRAAEIEDILLVGHEPGLSRFASQLLTGSPTGMVINFKKAAICALEVDPAAGDIAAILLWYAAPRQLRLMGE
jgi:phosphohistidine phosphatase